MLYFFKTEKIQRKQMHFPFVTLYP